MHPYHVCSRHQTEESKQHTPGQGCCSGGTWAARGRDQEEPFNTGQGQMQSPATGVK